MKSTFMIKRLRPLAAQAMVYNVIVQKDSWKLVIKQRLLAVITIVLDRVAASPYWPT